MKLLKNERIARFDDIHFDNYHEIVADHRNVVWNLRIRELMDHGNNARARQRYV